MSPSENLPDVISAASLVLAVLAALYTLWLPNVSAGLEVKPEPDKSNRKPQYEQVEAVLRTKALPLCIATLATVSILSPRCLTILCETLQNAAEGSFSDVKALFILTFSLTLLLAIVSIAQVIRLYGKLKELDYKPAT